MEKIILDDGYLVDSQFSQDDLTRTERLKSMFLDHFIMTMIIGLIFIIPSEIVKMIKPEINTEIFFFLSLALYFNKDSINSMGLGKRITNQIVIDKKTKKAASIYKCAISMHPCGLLVAITYF